MSKKQFLVSACMIIFIVALTLVISRIGPSYNSTGSANTQATSTASRTSGPLPAVPTASPLQAEYHIGKPNDLILVDPQGRRTGMNPITRTFYHEIPGTAYGEDCLSKTNCVGELFFSQEPGVEYSLYVLGGKTGAYWVDAYIHRPFDKTQELRGDIQIGSVIKYSQIYEPLSLTSSTPTYRQTYASTASITSAPPHNLPPPPVPTPPPPVQPPPQPVSIIPGASSSTPSNLTSTPSSTLSSSSPLQITTSTLPSTTSTSR